MEVDPHLTWDGLWKKVSHKSYPPTVYESCTRVPPSKVQYIDEEVLEICSEDELDSEYTEPLNPPPISTKEEIVNVISDTQPTPANYCDHTINPGVNQVLLEQEEEKGELPGTTEVDPLPPDSENENFKQVDIILAPSPVYTNAMGVEKSTEYLHLSDRIPEATTAAPASPANDDQSPSCQKGKWFRNGAQRRSYAQTPAEEYVSCHLCNRLFRGTRARNIHTNKAHAVVSSKRRHKMMKITSAIAGTEDDTIDKPIEKCPTAPESEELCSPLTRKRMHRSSLESPDTNDPQTKQHCEELPRLTMEAPQLAPAYTVSSAPDESHSIEKPLKLRIVSVESTKRRYHSTCLSSASCSHQSPVSSSSSLCLGNPCTLSSPDQFSSPVEYKVDHIFIGKRSRNSQDKATSSTTTQSTVCLTREKAAVDEDAMGTSTELIDVNGQSRVDSTTESPPSVTSGGGEQNPRPLNKLSLDTNIRAADGSYQCRICKRLYSNRFSLTGHYKVHYNILNKPYICDECSQRFTSQSNLKYHQLRNCPVLRVKALKNGTLPLESLPRNTGLLLAKAKRAIARKAGTIHSSRTSSSTTSDKSRGCGSAPLPSTLNTLKCVTSRQIKKGKPAVKWPSGDDTERPLPDDDVPQSPPTVLSTSRIPHATDRKQDDVPLPKSACAAGSHGQQQQQLTSPSHVLESYPTVTDTLLPCVKRIIDQAYDSEELRNKIVTLTSAAILSLISQAIPQAAEYTGVTQGSEKKPALSPSLSANHVLQVMADSMLRNQRGAQPGSNTLNTDAPDGIKQSECTKRASFSDSPSQAYSCPNNDPPYSPCRNELQTQSVVDHLFRQATSSPNTSTRPPFSLTVQTGVPSDSTRRMSSPHLTLTPKSVCPTTPLNKSRQSIAVGRQALAVVQSKTCPKCDRTFVSLSACRSHHTKVHVGSQHDRQVTYQPVEK